MDDSERLSGFWNAANGQDAGSPLRFCVYERVIKEDPHRIICEKTCPSSVRTTGFCRGDCKDRVPPKRVFSPAVAKTLGKLLNGHSSPDNGSEKGRRKKL